MCLIVDPPSGWMYGFPKPVPDDWLEFTPEQKEQWYKDNGYPEELIKRGNLKYVRYWKHNGTS